MSTSTPRVYIACLASYNAGMLHGAWIDLDGSDGIEEAIENIMLTSPIRGAEEWALHDHENCGSLSETTALSELMAIAEAYEECERKHIDWDTFLAFCDHISEDPSEDQITKYQDAFAGQSHSLPDWCEEFLDETGQLESIPDNLRYYFNFHAYARDLEVNDVFTVEHQHDVLVFWRQ